jgi:DNA-binding HxlR family transcriptional regulator
MTAETQPPWCACPGGPAGCQQPYCPYYQYVVELLGRRWAGSIVRALLAGVTRFSALAATIPDLSDRMLSERLKELEEAGIVARVVIPATPVRVEYHLTERGQALRPLMAAAQDWAAAWLPERGEGGQ